MKTAQVGDRVRVRYVKRSQDGSAAPSRSRGPVEMTVGIDRPRLPGLGLALVGQAPAQARRSACRRGEPTGLPTQHGSTAWLARTSLKTSRSWSAGGSRSRTPWAALPGAHRGGA
jgi:hypothetical protein